MSVCTPKSFDLTGKVALVTGASYGIGFAIAEGMAKAGATIVFNDIRQELVDKGLAAYKEAGVEAHGYVCDVTDEDAVQAMVKQIAQEVGVIDILVNNAGIIKRIPMCEMTAAQFRQVVDVDLNAPFIVSKACIPGMIEKGHGKIINVCSILSELGRETVAAYTAAKGGISALTHALAVSLAGRVRVNAIAPGWIDTDYTVYEGPDAVQQPAGRVGNPMDIANMVLYLCSDKAGFITGENICIDGGMTRQMIYHNDFGWTLQGGNPT